MNHLKQTMTSTIGKLFLITIMLSYFVAQVNSEGNVTIVSIAKFSKDGRKLTNEEGKTVEHDLSRNCQGFSYCHSLKETRRGLQKTSCLLPKVTILESHQSDICLKNASYFSSSIKECQEGRSINCRKEMVLTGLNKAGSRIVIGPIHGRRDNEIEKAGDKIPVCEGLESQSNEDCFIGCVATSHWKCEGSSAFCLKFNCVQKGEGTCKCKMIDRETETEWFLSSRCFIQSPGFEIKRTSICEISNLEMAPEPLSRKKRSLTFSLNQYGQDLILSGNSSLVGKFDFYDRHGAKLNSSFFKKREGDLIYKLSKEEALKGKTVKIEGVGPKMQDWKSETLLTEIDSCLLLDCVMCTEAMINYNCLSSTNKSILAMLTTILTILIIVLVLHFMLTCYAGIRAGVITASSIGQAIGYIVFFWVLLMIFLINGLRKLFLMIRYSRAKNPVKQNDLIERMAEVSRKNSRAAKMLGLATASTCIKISEASGFNLEDQPKPNDQIWFDLTTQFIVISMVLAFSFLIFFSLILRHIFSRKDKETKKIIDESQAEIKGNKTIFDGSRSSIHNLESSFSPRPIGIKILIPLSILKLSEAREIDQDKVFDTIIDIETKLFNLNLETIYWTITSILVMICLFSCLGVIYLEYRRRDLRAKARSILANTREMKDEIIRIRENILQEKEIDVPQSISRRKFSELLMKSMTKEKEERKDSMVSIDLNSNNSMENPNGWSIKILAVFSSLMVIYPLWRRFIGAAKRNVKRLTRNNLPTVPGLDEETVQIINDSNTVSTRSMIRKSRLNNPSLLLSTLVILSLFSPISSSGCGSGAIISSTLKDCLTKEGVEECSTEINLNLNMANSGDSSCFNLQDSDTGTVVSYVRIDYLAMECRWETSELYFTSDWEGGFTWSKRCSGSKNCYYGECPDELTNDASGELTENHWIISSFGRTSCMASCGCMGCGCFYCNDGCMFYRWGIRPKGEFYAVQEIGRSECSVHLEVRLEIPGKETQIINHKLNSNMRSIGNEFLEITLGGAFKSPEILFSDSKVVRGVESGSHWLIPASPVNQETAGLVGDLQLSEPKAPSFDTKGVVFPIGQVNCYSVSSGRISCNFPSTGARTIRQDKRFPLHRMGHLLKIENGDIVTTSLSSSVSLNVQSRGTFKVERKRNLVCPKASLKEISGCYDCKSGASISIRAQSTCESGPVSVFSEDTSVTIITPLINIERTEGEYHIKITTKLKTVNFLLVLSHSKDTLCSITIKGTLDRVTEVIQMNDGAGEGIKSDTRLWNGSCQDLGFLSFSWNCGIGFFLKCLMISLLLSAMSFILYKVVILVISKKRNRRKQK